MASSIVRAVWDIDTLPPPVSGGETESFARAKQRIEDLADSKGLLMSFDVACGEQRIREQVVRTKLFTAPHQALDPISLLGIVLSSGIYFFCRYFLSPSPLNQTTFNRFS